MPACFIDSNLWLYVHLTDQDPAKRDILRRELRRPERRVISTQVVAEVSCNLIKKGGMAEPRLRDILGLLRQSCDIVPVTVATGLRASALREAHGFSFWDSLIVASALEAGCAQLWSEDLQHGRTIEGLHIVNPMA